MKLSRKFLIINGSALIIMVVFILIIGFFYYINIKQDTVNQSVKALKKSYQEELSTKKEIWTGNALLIANNPSVKQSLLTNNRESLGVTLKEIGKEFKKNTNFHNIKIHVIDDELRSFYKTWAPENFGEKLDYAEGYQWVKKNGEGKCAMEVSPKGLRLKGLFPVYHENEFLGIINFEGGLNSIKRNLKPLQIDFLYFADKDKLHITKSISDNPQFNDYVLSQKDTNAGFFTYVQNSLNAKKLEEQDHLLDNKYLTIQGRFKNFTGKDTGLYLLGMKRNHVMGQVNQTMNMLFTILGVLLAVFAVLLIALNYFINRVVIRPVNKGVSFAEAITRGDLTKEIDVKQKDEIGKLADTLHTMMGKLRTIVTSIKEGAANIAQAGEQISSGAQEVAQGSNQQASSAEEVSSSIEEMSASIKQNTDNANVTKKIADKAAEGMKSMYDATNASLKSIEEIADKILIINEIAEKTDLLAINAAIEAARAGEQGKGFGVVAGEIRNLADRTKQSGDEIIELSKNSKSITRDTAEKMDALLPEVKKTASLIKEIAATGEEQNTGADQVNQAINDLSNIIQQNAASAEESSTSAEELSAQADTLKQTVAFFSLEKQKAQRNETLKQLREIANKLNISLDDENFDESSKEHIIEKSREKLKDKGFNLNMGDKEKGSESDEDFEKY